MTATKTNGVRRISKEAAKVLEKVAASLWALGYHAYESQWMKNPKSEQFTTICCKVGEAVEMDGFVTVCISPDYVGGVFVQVLLPERKRINFIPDIDFPNW